MARVRERGPLWVAAGSGAVAGGAFGLSFTLAEIFTAYLAGGQFSPRWWAFLALWDVPAFVFLGAAASLLRGLRSERPGRSSGLADTAVVVLFPCLVFVSGAVVLNHELLRPYLLLSPLRAVAVVAVLGLTLLSSRLLVPSLNDPTLGPRVRETVALLLPFVVVLASYLALVGTGHTQLLPRSLAFLALLFAGVAAGGHIVPRAVVLVSTARRLAAAALACALLFGSVWARAMVWPSSSQPYRRDLPQPAGPGDEPWLRGKPNIVLIVLDTLRAANMSCYGYDRRTTPRIDAFAREAVLYSRHTAVAAWSLPAHAALFTGLLPSRQRDDDPGTLHHFPLPDRFDTLAEILLRRGYATAGIAANVLVGRTFNLDQGFRYYDAEAPQNYVRFPYPPLVYRAQLRLGVSALFPTYYRSAEEITGRAEEWISRRRPAGRPYFLFLNYLDSHRPYTPRGPFLDLWPGRAQDGTLPPNGLPGDAVREIATGKRDVTKEEYEHQRSLYDGTVSYLDHHVGRLLDFLRGRPDYEDTWIVVTADHGESLGEHRTLEHNCSLYQEILRVPLIIRYPRSISDRRGVVDDRPVQQVDVLPMLLEGLGIAPPPGIDGAALSKGRDVMIAETFTATMFPGTKRRYLKSIIQGDLKYIDTLGGAPQLFDLTRDPKENHNLAGALPDKAAELRGLMARWTGPAPPGAERHRAVEEIAKDRLERLKALGYVP